MTGPDPAWDPWTDQSYLRESQYKTDVNLAARQSIYAYQRPRIDLARETIGLAALGGQEVVADVGCGNGRYLAELARRGHAGPVLGVDMSPGMLLAARSGAPRASLMVADAMALPVRDAATDLTLVMHMLYHVPDPERAVRELRRITRPGGRVIVGLNGTDHLRELRGLITEALASLGRAPVRPREQISLDAGEQLLRSQFASVTRHDFESQLRVPDAEPIAAYVRSRVLDAGPIVPAVLSALPADPALFPVTTHSGCQVCT
jgi:ubiquinone/menaquinone biosynthesis C-methylase UbiE